MNLLSNYQGYRQCEVILVFDAYKVPGNPGEVSRFHNIYVVYTKEAETADAYIEKATYEIGKRNKVRVATSDNLEQLIILGHGAIRVSADLFRAEVEQVGEQISTILTKAARSGKNLAVKDALDRAMAAPTQKNNPGWEKRKGSAAKLAALPLRLYLGGNPEGWLSLLCFRPEGVQVVAEEPPVEDMLHQKGFAVLREGAVGENLLEDFFLLHPIGSHPHHRGGVVRIQKEQLRSALPVIPGLPLGEPCPVGVSGVDKVGEILPVHLG